jgi:hypothetical protein
MRREAAPDREVAVKKFEREDLLDCYKSHSRAGLQGLQLVETMQRKNGRGSV